MFGSSFEKMSNRMQWFIVVPTSLLLLAVAWFVFAFTTVAWHPKCMHGEMGNGKISIAVLDSARMKTQKLADFLDQQQTQNNTETKIVNDKLNAAKAEHTKPDAITGLTAATNRLKNQSVQLADQQRNIKALQNDLMQLEQASKQSPTK